MWDAAPTLSSSGGNCIWVLAYDKTSGSEFEVRRAHLPQSGVRFCANPSDRRVAVWQYELDVNALKNMLTNHDEALQEIEACWTLFAHKK